MKDIYKEYGTKKIGSYRVETICTIYGKMASFNNSNDDSNEYINFLWIRECKYKFSDNTDYRSMYILQHRQVDNEIRLH